MEAGSGDLEAVKVVRYGTRSIMMVRCAVNLDANEELGI
jgi:hypothetical protein